MSVDPPPRPFSHLWTTAKEYLTHWFSAGVILTLTGHRRSFDPACIS